MSAALTIADLAVPARNNFNAIRLTAALGVIVSHGLQLSSGDPSREILAGVTYYNLGQHAVNVFFVLSGFMVTASLLRSESLVDFVTARVLRIYPGLIVAALALVFVAGPLVSGLPAAAYFADGTTYTFLLKSTLAPTGHGTLPGVFVANPVPDLVNVPIWTIKYELACYGVLAALSVFGALTRPRLTVCGMLAVAALTTAVFAREGTEHVPHSLDHLARFWFCFSFGAGLYLLRDRVPLRLSVLVVLAMAWWITAGSPLERLASALATGYGAFWLAALPLGGLRRLTNRIDLSYGVYIFGWPVMQAVLRWHPDIGLPGLEACSLAAVLVLAAGSWFLVEKPCLSRRAAVAEGIKRVANRLGAASVACAAAAPDLTGFARRRA